jgi:hypothetical protein
MLEQLEVNERNLASSYRHSTGRALPYFALPKRETLILGSGFSMVLRVKIINCWAELDRMAADQFGCCRSFQRTPKMGSEKIRAVLDKIEGGNVPRTGLTFFEQQGAKDIDEGGLFEAPSKPLPSALISASSPVKVRAPRSLCWMTQAVWRRELTRGSEPT